MALQVRGAHLIAPLKRAGSHAQGQSESEQHEGESYDGEARHQSPIARLAMLAPHLAGLRSGNYR
jgi:hypothetical protein